LLARFLAASEPKGVARVALPVMERGSRSVREIADVVGLSHRCFIGRFAAEVGLPPKLFLRVRRFQRVLALANPSKLVPWAELAGRCGYFDQAHLIRDFVAFAGITPGTYLRQRSQRVKENHVPFDA